MLVKAQSLPNTLGKGKQLIQIFDRGNLSPIDVPHPTAKSHIDAERTRQKKKCKTTT